MLTLDEIRDDALETLNNYGERFTVEVAKLYPDDPDEDEREFLRLPACIEAERLARKGA